MIPFIGTEAVANGQANRYQLTTNYDSIFRNVYVPKGHELTSVDRAHAAWLWSGRQSTAAGLSAAALLGSRWIDANEPAELYHPSRHPTPGILLHSDTVADDEIQLVGAVPTTTAARTAFDLGRRKGLTSGVIRLDALMQATDVKPADIAALGARHRGARGLVQLRAAIELSDAGAESPQETLTRLVLTAAGLRPKQTQIKVFDRWGGFVGRIDMGWDDWLVGVEYDGIQHWTDPEQRRRDIDRIAEFEALGWQIVRVGSDMLNYRPHTIVERTRAALAAAGWLDAGRT
jgi:hypothetical protein